MDSRASRPLGPDNGYVAARTVTGLKTDTPLAEISQSVSVVTKQELESRWPDQLEDALACTA